MYHLSKKSQRLLGKYLIKELEHRTRFKFCNTVNAVYISESTLRYYHFYIILFEHISICFYHKHYL